MADDRSVLIVIGRQAGLVQDHVDGPLMGFAEYRLASGDAVNLLPDGSSFRPGLPLIRSGTVA